MDLKQLIKKELRILKENNPKSGNYMFFSNLQQIHRQCEILLKMDQSMIDDALTNGHDWADDHVSVAKENMDQVLDFFMNDKEGEIAEDKNPCWDTHKVGSPKTKTSYKTGKRVNNCVEK